MITARLVAADAHDDSYRREAHVFRHTDELTVAHLQRRAFNETNAKDPRLGNQSIEGRDRTIGGAADTSERAPSLDAVACDNSGQHLVDEKRR